MNRTRPEKEKKTIKLDDCVKFGAAYHAEYVCNLDCCRNEWTVTSRRCWSQWKMANNFGKVVTHDTHTHIVLAHDIQDARNVIIFVIMWFEWFVSLASFYSVLNCGREREREWKEGPSPIQYNFHVKRFHPLLTLTQFTKNWIGKTRRFSEAKGQFKLYAISPQIFI